jgi:hypothetical protein
MDRAFDGHSENLSILTNIEDLTHAAHHFLLHHRIPGIYHERDLQRCLKRCDKTSLPNAISFNALSEAWADLEAKVISTAVQRRQDQQGRPRGAIATHAA